VDAVCLQVIRMRHQNRRHTKYTLIPRPRLIKERSDLTEKVNQEKGEGLKGETCIKCECMFVIDVMNTEYVDAR